MNAAIPRLLSATALVCGCALLLVIHAGCAQPNEYQEPPPPTVTVAQPLRKTVTKYLEETGTTEAVKIVEIRARVRGILEQVNFEPGQQVRGPEDDPEEKEPPLYVIEPQEYQAAVDAAAAEVAAQEVELQRAETEYQRQLNLQKQEATSETAVVTAQADRDAAKAARDAANAALERAKIDLGYTEIRAPITGRVGKTLVKAGNLVGDGEATHLTTIIQYDPIYANFNISEQAYLRLIADVSPEQRRGEDVPDSDGEATREKVFELARPGIDDGFPFQGRYNYADLAVDQSTGTYMVRAIFPNPDLDLVPGLFVRVRVPMEKLEDALLVPEVAVGMEGEQSYVRIVNAENQVERRSVKLGVKEGNKVVVLEGLSGDEWVVYRGVQRARDGAEVSPERVPLEDHSQAITVVTKGDSDTAPSQDASASSAADPSADEAPAEDGDAEADARDAGA
jgi:RND family efflux transporter MFP subunit